jgi:hypothetical protein
MNGKKKLSGGATFTPLLRTFIRRVSWILAAGPKVGFVAAVRLDSPAERLDLSTFWQA